MLSIYIVDDEPMAVRYLEMLLRESGAEYEIAGTQTSPVRAVSEIRTLQPDIVFTDISMPLMDGLALAEKVLMDTESRVYLLTSFEDFEFAKKGVKIGVSDYLLKNELTGPMLAALLHDAEEEIRAARRERHLVLEHNIRDFLLGHSAAGEDRTYEDRAMQRYALLTFYKPERFWMDPGMAVQEHVRLDCYGLQQAETPKGMRCAAFAQVRTVEYCAVVFISETVVDSRRRLFQMADGLLSKIRETDPAWRCLCSEILLHFFELQGEYKKLSKLTGYLYAQAEQSVLFGHDIACAQAEKPNYDERLEEMYRLLTEGRHEAAVAAAEAFFAYCQSRDTQDAYIAHMRGFYQMLRRCALRDGRGLEHLTLSACYTTALDLERAMLNCVEMYFEERERVEDAGYSEHVLQALKFIHREYTKDISVSDIASFVGISEGHLRRLFKQEMGMSVVDCLTDYRMDRAKLLLRERFKSASEVWKETGFSSAQYFSYVFKRKEGMSPREYQRQIGNGATDGEAYGKNA